MTIFRTGKSSNKHHLCKINKCPIESLIGIPITLTHDSDFSGPIIVYVYDENKNFLLVRLVSVAVPQQTVYLDDDSVWLFGRKLNEPEPEISDLVSQISLVGISDADIDVRNEDPFTFHLDDVSSPLNYSFTSGFSTGFDVEAVA